MKKSARESSLMLPYSLIHRSITGFHRAITLCVVASSVWMGAAVSPGWAAADLGTADPTASSAIADCYRLAGEPYAPPAFQGVAIDGMETDAALKACEAARVLDPKDAMLLDLTGRAYQARNDFVHARQFFAQADRAGNAYGTANLALFLIEGAGGPADPARGLAMLEDTATSGNILAQYSLGLAYREGRAGLEPDGEKALLWLGKAGAQGHAIAMYDLAIMLRDGNGVTADPRTAFGWMEKAAASGDADSMAALGYAHEQGLGTPADFAAAREWYGKAAEKNQIDAMTNLGRLFEAGEGGAVDYERAFTLYSAAAEGGNAIAMANLANLYEFGSGTNASPRDAAYWLARAIMAGNADIIEQLAESPDAFSVEVRVGLQSFIQSRGLYDGPIDGTMSTSAVSGLRKLNGQTP